MRYWAEVNEENEVVFVHQLDMDNPYDVYETDNRLIETFNEGTTGIGVFAGIGCIYVESLGLFIPPKRYASWVLNEQAGQFEAPIPVPDMDNPYDYAWDEEVGLWINIGKDSEFYSGKSTQ